jgi:hypothetical protein
MAKSDEQVHCLALLVEPWQAAGHISGQAGAGKIAIKPGAALYPGDTQPRRAALLCHQAAGNVIAKVKARSHTPHDASDAPMQQEQRGERLMPCQRHHCVKSTDAKENAALFSAAEVRAWFLRKSGERAGTIEDLNKNGKQDVNRNDYLFGKDSCP